ncbi:MAG: type I 3-dehydroquinate dehydratase [Candidatus Hydrogenedentes bacterium]|nr:type I 3-dehydroquinate dehydratase [Candidatus Hydrogenedentota bacterium]
MSRKMVKDIIKNFATPRIIGCSKNGYTPNLVKRVLKYNVIGFEIRADYLLIHNSNNLNRTESMISKSISAVVANLILFTVRSKKEGGEFSDSYRLKESIFLEFIPWIDILDIEINELHKYKQLILSAKEENKCILASFHNFKTVPPINYVKQLISKAQDLGADFVKIVGTANTTKELINLIRIQLEYGDSVPLSVMGMGRFALISRVILSNIGSIWTYGSVGAPTAPNQPTCKQIYKLSKMIFGETK